MSSDSNSCAIRIRNVYAIIFALLLLLDAGLGQELRQRARKLDDLNNAALSQQRPIVMRVEAQRKRPTFMSDMERPRPVHVSTPNTATEQQQGPIQGMVSPSNLCSGMKGINEKTGL